MRRIACSSTAASFRPRSRSRSSRWNAIRCALLPPTPGRQRSASISSARSGELFMGPWPRMGNREWRVGKARLAGSRAWSRDSPFPISGSKRHLEPGRQVHPGGDAAELVLAGLGNFVDGVVHGGGDEVFRHLGVVGKGLPVDLHAAHFMRAGHHHADQAAAGAAGDFEFRDLLLRALHVFLHALRLLHQLTDLSSHHLAPGSLPKGLTDCGTTRAPKSRFRLCTSGSSSIACSAALCALSRALAARAAGVCMASAWLSLTKRRRMVSPSAWLMRSSIWLTMGSTAMPMCAGCNA